jgi:hypothetical protein
MIHKLTAFLFLALAFWHAQLAGAQCVADNVRSYLQWFVLGVRRDATVHFL